MARLLLQRDLVVKAGRYAALVLSALGALAIATPAFADSINLLRQASKGLSPSILIDPAKRPLDSDDQAAASIDEDCVAVPDRARTSSSRFGSVRWNFGQLTWEWEQADGPSLIYILCVDPQREAAPLSGGGGLGFMAGLSWSGAQPAARSSSGAPPIPSVVSGERPISIGAPNAIPTSSIGNFPTGNSDGLPIGNTDGPPIGTPDSPLSPFIGRDLISPVTLTPDYFPVAGTTMRAVGGGNEDAPIVPFDPPITMDQGEMAPVPEPGTLLLLGTGLAAAWRAARKRK